MDACIDEQENFNGYLDWDGCPDVLAAESTTPTKFDLTVMDSMIVLIPVQQILKLGTNTMMMMVAQILLQNNKDLSMMMISDDIINDEDLCPLDPEDFDGDRDTDGCPDN